MTALTLLLVAGLLQGGQPTLPAPAGPGAAPPRPEQASPVQRLIDAARPGDRIVVPAGTYEGDLVIDRPHPVLEGVQTGDHAYFVHSFHFVVERSEHLLAHADYAGPITAIVGRDNMVGTQFHPEKSQAVGLRIISNFLNWKP